MDNAEKYRWLRVKLLTLKAEAHYNRDYTMVEYWEKHYNHLLDLCMGS